MNLLNRPDMELDMEKLLRKTKYIIPIASLVMAVLLLWGIILLMNLFTRGHFWACIPAGFLAQSFLIICLHDGTHSSITQTRVDCLIANISAALLFMPFGEFYRKYHLIHHCNTNLEHDPISPPTIRKLFIQNRYYYILCECIPLLFTFYVVLNYQKIENRHNRSPKITMSTSYLITSIIISVVWFILVEPSIEFILFTLIIFNLVTVVRNWCEHMGTESIRKSNTYWFPLGLGIGNHDLHHRKPNLSWLTLTLGLPFRKKDTSPIRALIGILFDKSFSFYVKR